MELDRHASQNSSSPIRRLSPELIYIIFSHLQSPIPSFTGWQWTVVAAVCCSWRYLTLRHGSLWSHLRALSGTSPEQLALYIYRSKQAPLNLYIYDMDCCTSFLKSFSSLSHRIQKVEFEVGCDSLPLAGDESCSFNLNDIAKLSSSGRLKSLALPTATGLELTDFHVQIVGSHLSVFATDVFFLPNVHLPEQGLTGLTLFDRALTRFNKRLFSLTDLLVLLGKHSNSLRYLKIQQLHLSHTDNTPAPCDVLLDCIEELNYEPGPLLNGEFDVLDFISIPMTASYTVSGSYKTIKLPRLNKNRITGTKNREVRITFDDWDEVEISATFHCVAGSRRARLTHTSNKDLQDIVSAVARSLTDMDASDPEVLLISFPFFKFRFPLPDHSPWCTLFTSFRNLRTLHISGLPSISGRLNCLDSFLSQMTKLQNKEAFDDGNTKGFILHPHLSKLHICDIVFSYSEGLHFRDLLSFLSKRAKLGAQIECLVIERCVDVLPSHLVEFREVVGEVIYYAYDS